MENNVRAFLVAEMGRQAREAERSRRGAVVRDDSALSEWAARSAGRSAGRGRIVEEHSRVSPVTPLPRAMASDRVLRGTTITGREDEEKRRRLPEAPAAKKAKAGAGQSGAETPTIGRGASLSSRAGALARGYQPAVVKVVSYAHGAARASATANYVDREDATLETHEAIVLKGREAINAEIADWSKDFEQRAESQDVSSVRLGVIGLHDNDADRATLEKAVAAAFEGHSYAFRIDALASGAIEARAVVAFAGTLPPGAEGEKPKTERFSVTERRVGTKEEGFSERVFAPKSEARMKARIEEATGLGQHRLSIEPGTPGHGQSSVIHRLTQLTERAPAISSNGAQLNNASAILTEARAWRRDLRSFKPRDTMHVIVSAKAGTDVEAFTNSVRGFLHEQFADHKFMFGVHTDKADAGHIHAHAIVTVRNAEGIKIHPGPQDFRGWRETFAEHAQSNSLKIVATSAAERASSQSYGPKDKAIVDAAERPRPGREARDRAYASEPANQPLIDNARRRIEMARDNPIRFPASERQRAVVNEARSSWVALANADPTNSTALQNLSRTAIASMTGDILAKIGFRVESYKNQETTMASAVSSEQLSADLRRLNDTSERVTQLLDPASREAFNERSSRYLETLANRIDLKRMSEQGAQTVSREQVERIAGAKASRIVSHAEEIAKADSLRAQSARHIAETTAAAARRDNAQTNLDPASVKDLQDGRRAAALTERDAAQVSREAAAAREAARLAATNPAQVISQNLVSEDQRLAELRREQERLAKELEEQGPQRDRQTHRQRPS